MVASSYRFRPRLWPSIAAAIGILATLSLANWQLNRAQEKAGRQQTLEKLAAEPAVQLSAGLTDAATLEFRNVEVTGEFDPPHTIYLDNKIRNGKVGYEIVTPLRLSGSRQYVLVNRGWIAANAKRGDLPVVPTPSGQVTVLGTAMVPSKKILELSGQTYEGAVWENLVIERYRTRSGLDVQPVVIQQRDGDNDGLLREWPRPDTGIAKHQGYAFQWFALSLAIAIVYLVMNVKRAEPESN